MKTIFVLLVSLISIACARSQGTLNINPVPVTNAVTGTLADSTIVAALYFGPTSATENDLILLSSATALVGGFATFSSTILPAIPVGSSALLQVRAWSAGFPSYETAVSSGLPSVLAGKSIVLTATLGNGSSPPPIPNPLVFSGFSVTPVPEPEAVAFYALGTMAWWWSRRKFRTRPGARSDGSVDGHRAGPLKSRMPQLNLAVSGWIILFLSAGLVGCTSPRVTRTIGVAGLPPITAAEVSLFESGKPAPQDYEAIGKITISRQGGGIGKGFAREQMKKAAAQMGANAVVEIKDGVALGEKQPEIYRSGKAVKWLDSGNERHSRTLPFVVAVLPIPEDPTASGNQAAINQAAYEGAVGALEVRGYWVLSNTPSAFNFPASGLEGLKALPDDQLLLAGGPEADCLLELAFVNRAQANILIGASAVVGVRAQLMDKATRKILYDGNGTGSGYTGWLLNLTVPNAKRAMAAQYGAAGAIKTMKPICTAVEP